jgi:hypothetical protein
MKLILEISQQDEDGALHRAVERFPATIGRGYHNDIILSDPHIGESHLRIDYDGQVWTLTDLGSVNPTQHNAKALRSATAPLASGDTLRLGNTTLRVFDPAHAIPPPIKMQKASPAFLWLNRPRNVWASFLLAVASVCAWSYVAVWTENLRLALVTAATGTMIAIVLWAALWSAAGRLLRRRSWFMAHMALISLACVFSVASWFLSSYIGFLTSEGSFSSGFGYLLDAVLVTLLLYGSLSLSTLMKKRKRTQAALFFSGGLVLGIFAVGFIGSEKFSPDALYPYKLEPFLSGVAREETVDSFMDRSAKVFDDAEFKRKKEKDADRETSP